MVGDDQRGEHHAQAVNEVVPAALAGCLYRRHLDRPLLLHDQYPHSSLGMRHVFAANARIEYVADFQGNDFNPIGPAYVHVDAAV